MKKKKLISYQNTEIQKYKKFPLQEFSIQFKGKIPSGKEIALIINAIRIVSKANKQIVLGVSIWSINDDNYELKWLVYPYRSKEEQEKVTYPDTISGVDIFKSNQPIFKQVEFEGIGTPVTLPLLVTAPRILFAVATILIGLGWIVNSLKSKQVRLSEILAFPQLLLIFGSLAIGLLIIREFKKQQI